MARKLKTYRLEWDRSAPELLQAVSIALGVLWHVRCTTVDDLAAAVAAGDAETLRLMRELVIDPDAQALLDDDDIAPILNLLRSRAHGGKVLTVAECPVCGEWFHPGSAAVPAKCFLTSGCPGKPAKPAALRKIDIEAEAAELAAAAAAAELEAAGESERDEHDPDPAPDDTATPDDTGPDDADRPADDEPTIDPPADPAPEDPELVDAVLVDDEELEGGDPFA